MKTYCIVLLAAALFGQGCTQFARRHERMRAHLDEQSRALTTAIVDSLQSTREREPASDLALRLARQDQRIEGLPLEPIAVAPLLEPGNESAQRALEKRESEIEQLLRQERHSAERLQRFGATFEAERNATRWRWTRWAGGGSLLIGGLVALVVFVPAALPIVTRFAAWIVGRIPALASALGVVSTRAFDAVVKAIERSKRAPSTTSWANSAQGPSLEELHLNLSREMDATHKELVRSRKASLAV
jgi:hypothetical protein